MRHHLFLLLLGAGVMAGCGDDTSGGGGSGGDPSTGGSGAGNNGGGDEGGAGGGTGGMGEGGTGAVGPGFSCEAAPADPGTVTITPFADVGAQGLVQLKSAPGAPDRLFAVMQGGEVLIVENGAVLPTPFIDIGGIIEAGGEEGLLGLAFHPDYATNGRFFLHYSAAGSHDSTVEEFAVSADPLVANPDPVQLVLQHPTDEFNHNGGAVEFGNDGFLYISLGDGGAQNDPGCDAQNVGTLLGKIVRLDVDAAPTAEGYPAAAGNPNGAKYYHIGFRNPWRMSFDACTGDLYIGDVGQNAWEEVDLATEDAGAINFGWPYLEGTHAHGNDCPPQVGEIVDPIAEYAQTNDGGSVTGGYVYRGSVSPNLRGWYFYSDFVFSAYYMLRVDNGAVVDQPVQLDFGVSSTATFGQDGNGEVYVTNYFGEIFRIESQ